MVWYGPLLWVSTILGVILLFLGIMMVSAFIVAPLLYHVNLFGVRHVVTDVVVSVLGIDEPLGTGGAVAFTVVYIVVSVLVFALGAILLHVPSLAA